MIALSGEDARSFLQGLVSNDVEKVAAGRAIYAALLTPQGKYLHDFFVAEANGRLLIDAETARLADLERRLTLYRLRAKVTIERVEGHVVAALWGENAPRTLTLPSDAGREKPLGRGIAFADPRLPHLGLRAILPQDEAEATLSRLGFTRTEASAYDRHRLAIGVPDGSRDLEVEKSTLLESNFEELHGVDFDKGCYVGQELTARTKYRGLVKKRLFPVTLDGPAPAPGTPVTLDGGDIGDMRSAADGYGLALLRLDCIENALKGDRVLLAGGVRLRPTRPDWMS
ncbi:MAG: folate-binding protein [Alphaproteobacteria bacterium]